jgi:hypothetical protein
MQLPHVPTHARVRERLSPQMGQSSQAPHAVHSRSWPAHVKINKQQKQSQDNISQSKARPSISYNYGTNVTFKSPQENSRPAQIMQRTNSAVL